MGQKVNAIGLRLGVNRDWDSIWYSDEGYSSSLHRDLGTINYLTQSYEKEDVLISRVVIKRGPKKTLVFLHAYIPKENSVGKFVNIKNLEKTLATLNGTEIEFKVVDIIQYTKRKVKVLREISLQLSAYKSKKFFNEGLQLIGTAVIVKSASLLSKFFAKQIEADFRHNQFIDFVKKALPLFLESFPEVKGVRVQFKGRLNGSDRSKTQWFKFGQIPFHTLEKKIDYSYTPAFTLYGVCGIKVWLCFNDTEKILNKNASSKTSKV